MLRSDNHDSFSSLNNVCAKSHKDFGEAHDCMKYMYVYLKFLLGCAWLDCDGSVYAIITTSVEVGVQTKLASPCVLIAYLSVTPGRQTRMCTHVHVIIAHLPVKPTTA